MRRLLVAVCVLGAVSVAACAPAVVEKTDTSAGTATTYGGDRQAGALDFRSECAACHGPTGVELGRVGPSLRNERERMGFDAAVSWIEDPEPPMPKLYPKSLTEHQVRDLAAYVESL